MIQPFGKRCKYCYLHCHILCMNMYSQCCHMSYSFPGSLQLPSEFELTPGVCFESQLFSGRVNCSAKLQVYVLVDGVENYFNILSPSLPLSVSYMLSADHQTLSICLASSAMSHENVTSSLMIQEICMQRASHICNHENDNQTIIYYGNRGIFRVNSGK